MGNLIRWVFFLSLIPTFVAGARYNYVARSEFRALRRYLRSRHYMDWIRLGAPDNVTEMFIERGIGSLPPIIKAVEGIEDPVVQEHVQRLRVIDRFGTRVTLPFLMICIFSGLLHSVINR